MNKKDLAGQLEITFADINVSVSQEGKIKISAIKEQIQTILKYLKDKEYNHLALISCVDWIEKEEFELVYILTAYTDNGEEYLERGDIYLKVRVPRNNPEVDTVINVFENAEPYEREIHELYGVKFNNHPRLSHLLLERDYEIPPFRKDFNTRNYVEEVFGSIPEVKGEEE